MGWAKFDDRRHTNGKLIAAGLAANGLDANGITYAAANETDGFIEERVLPLLAPNMQPKKRTEIVGQLIEVGRWKRDEEQKGWWIHDFLDYHTPHADLEKRREAERERKQRQRHGDNGQFQAESDARPAGHQAESEGCHTVPFPSPPVPPLPAPSPPDPLVVTTPDNCKSLGADESGTEASNAMGENQLRDLITRLRKVCTASNRKTVDRESTLVIAQCLQHSDVEIVAAAVAELEKWSDPPPTLPRALFEPFKIECRKRGKPAPMLKLPEIGKRAS